MRGTMELNEDILAHLDALDRQRQQAEQENKDPQKEALATFRAEQADRMEAASEETTNVAAAVAASSQKGQSTSKSKSIAAATIVVV